MKSARDLQIFEALFFIWVMNKDQALHIIFQIYLWSTNILQNLKFLRISVERRYLWISL